MKNIIKTTGLSILTISVLVTISGCARTAPSTPKQLSMTYDSNPKGAKISCSGVDYGTAPVELYYTIDEKDRNSGLMSLSPCVATWVSGARAGGEQVKADLNTTGYFQIYTYQRPRNIGGYEIDENYVLKEKLLKEGKILEAYQAGLIDKDKAKLELLRHGKIIEAYEAGLIDKDTADLYLKKQANNNAERAAEEQARAANAQAQAQEAAASEARRNNSNNAFQQSLQNTNNNIQKMINQNQNNINSYMRQYY